MTESERKRIKELDVTKKHRIGIINSKLRPILHKYQEGKMSLTLSLDKIHEVFKEEDETKKICFANSSHRTKSS
ncbi:MAG: hypothetical protein DDT22_00914 [candidate division WS2 bacterium]|nr:hypothetical protein [Candidatus Lithacetigena glycinireducens]